MMTLLARFQPGPPVRSVSPFACCERISASDSPKRAEPPTRKSSRRVMPSQVALPWSPGITSIGHPPKNGGRQVGAQYRYVQLLCYIFGHGGASIKKIHEKQF